MNWSTDQFATLRQARDNLVRDGLLHGDVSAPVSDLIARSWRRSLAGEVSTDRLAFQWRDPSGRSELLCRSAALVVDRLHADLGELGVAVFLSDPRGRILRRRAADAVQRRRLDASCAAEGFDFSEPAVGTNGIGTVLEERAPMFVHGAEHFNDLLEPLTCAGAPIRLPSSDRVAGSMALACSVDAANPMMLSLAVQAAREIEQVMTDLEGGRNRALVDALAFKSRTTTGPVVVLTRDAVLSNTAGLAYVTPEHHPLLWEAVSSGQWDGAPRTIELDLPPGPVKVIVRRIADPAGPAFRVEIQPHIADDRTSSPDSTFVPTTSLHLLSEVDARLGGVVRVASAIAINGHGGTGKYHTSRAIAALDARSDVHDVHVVDLTRCRTANGARWLRAALDALSAGQSLILRHLEDVDNSDVNTIKALTAVLRHAADTDTDTSRGRLLLNIDLQRASRQVADLIGQRAVIVTLPDLCEMKPRIPELAQTLLTGLDGVKPGTMFSSETRQALMTWHWPGNLNELRQTMLEVAAGRPSWMICLSDLPLWLRDAAQGRQLTGLERAERNAIIAALQETHGNRSAAAALLGMGRTTLYRRTRALRMDRTEWMPR